MTTDSLVAYRCQIHTAAILVESHDLHLEKKNAENDAKHCYDKYLSMVGRTPQEAGYKILSTTFTKIVIKK